MENIATFLKRSYAEAPEPEDNGFTVAVSRRVAVSEQTAQVRFAAQMAGVIVGVAAASYGLWGFLSTFGPDLVASAGLEVARAHGALSGGPTVSTASITQSLGAGLTQVLLVVAAMAGGAVAYRNAQE